MIASAIAGISAGFSALMIMAVGGGKKMDMAFTVLGTAAIGAIGLILIFALLWGAGY